MLVKEYRILLPLSVEEYRIAQLYMIQRKSQEETKGAGSGVEIIVNEPYSDEDGNTGQYTFKIYHIGSHMPAWFRSILPESAMKVVEEAWNAYPYTKTRFSCPFIEKFFIEVETRYFNDPGNQENVFGLSKQELQERIIDYMDIVKDPIASSDYLASEDPLLYKSKVTGRGPLTETWVQDCISGGKAIMCAYKLCKVQFNYWGMQSKVEKFVHDFALRRTMLRAHRQAWAWQDEWVGLEIEDVRKLELQAQVALNRVMAGTDSSQRPISGMGSIPSVGIDRLADNKVTLPNGSKKEDYSSDDESDLFYDAIESSSICDQDIHLQNIPSWSASAADPTADVQTTAIKHLLLLFHGGYLVDVANAEVPTHIMQQDVSTFSATLESVISRHYQSMHGGIFVRPVPCGNVYTRSLKVLQSISPSSAGAAQNLDLARKFWAYASSVVPILSVASPEYNREVSAAILSANQVYQNFLHSPLGHSFAGKVSICGDAVGGLVAFDALCRRNAGTAADRSIGHLLSPIADDENEEVEQQDHSVRLPVALQRENSLGCQKVTAKDRMDDQLQFPVENLFLFGTALGLVLASRKASKGSSALYDCTCPNVFNLYYASDLSSARIEPLLLNDFSAIPPAKVQRYSQYPLGDGQSLHMLDWMQGGYADDRHGVNSTPGTPLLTSRSPMHQRSSRTSSVCDMTASTRKSSAATTVAVDALSLWWGWKRIDYTLYAPDDMSRMPFLSLSSFFYSSYWESFDVAAFILRQLISAETVPSDVITMDDGACNKAKDKWLKRHTGLKLTNVASNHRANDVIVSEGNRQMLTARFMYGPFDMITLTGEEVEVYLMKQVPVGEWVFCGCELTDSHGRLRFELKERLPSGLYPVRMIVKGDRTFLDLCLAVLPPDTECVVFSIDGSFTASMSLTGKNPKVRPAAVDVARFWQDLGYLIIYISARPDVQQRVVTSWLAEHNFPFGLLYFNEGFSHDLLRQKTHTLKMLISEFKIKIHAAYGSAKDIRGYRELNLPMDHIFAIGRVSKKLQSDCVALLDGYSSHLDSLWNDSTPVVKPATGAGQAVVQRSRLSFGDYLSKLRGNASVQRTQSFTPQCRTRHFHGKNRGDGPASRRQSSNS